MFFAEVGGGRDGVGVGCALGGTERVPFPAVDDGLQLQVEAVEVDGGRRVKGEGGWRAEGRCREECRRGGEEKKAE